jgi:hypothetical protein
VKAITRTGALRDVERTKRGPGAHGSAGLWVVAVDLALQKTAKKRKQDGLEVLEKNSWFKRAA